jgi:hypothetical protein
MQIQGSQAAATSPRPSPFVVVRDGPGGSTIKIPVTSEYIQGLRARRQALSDQLLSVDARRWSSIRQLQSLGETGNATAKKGVTDRLAFLDRQQLQLESSLAAANQELSSLPAALVASASIPPPTPFRMKPDQVMTLSVLAIVLVCFPLAFAAARGIWKKSNRPGLPPTAFAETAQRLDRLEGTVDTIAIEIERISEGQRYVTKLLSDAHQEPILEAGQRSSQPVR